MLSRNFRLQKVGNLEWLFDNYDLANVSHGLDELIIIDVSREKKNVDKFCESIKVISQKCFIPLTAGGGIYDFSVASKYLRSGADKLLLSSAFHREPSLCLKIASNFGRQCVVGVIDYETHSDGSRKVKVQRGQVTITWQLEQWALHLEKMGAGEIIFQCMEKDGTGMGLDLDLFKTNSLRQDLPYILMGGIGKGEHIEEGLKNPFVDAVATANLFNFIGSTFLEIRENMLHSGLNLASWEEKDYDKYKGIFKS